MLPKNVTLKLSGDDAIMFNNAMKGYIKIVKDLNGRGVDAQNLLNIIHVHGQNYSEVTRIAMYVDTVIKAG